MSSSLPYLSGENGKESGETLVSWELLKVQKSDSFGVRKYDLEIAEKCMPWLSFDEVIFLGNFVVLFSNG